jgi:hypothetical protein
VAEITTPGACTAVLGTNGSITIDVPKATVSLESGTTALDSTLYSVTASTMTLQMFEGPRTGQVLTVEAPAPGAGWP